MRSGGHPFPDVHLAAWNVTKEKLPQIYFPTTNLKLLTTSILPVGQLQSVSVKLPRLLHGNTLPM